MVGQAFVVSLRAVPPAGRRAFPPAVPDTGGVVEPLDPPFVSRRGDTLLVRFRLIAWQPGVLTIPLDPVVMRRREQADIAVPSDIRVVVASVLPADSAERIPRQPRELLQPVAPWWANWWRWMTALIVGIALLFALYRWRTRTAAMKAITEPASPLAQADAAFARLDARKLVAHGEAARHVALSAEVLRQYLADVEPTLATTLTNRELLDAATACESIPLRTLLPLLQQVDAVRFGSVNVDGPLATQLGLAARDLVRDIDRARVLLARKVA